MDGDYNSILNRITFGVIQILEKKTGVCDVGFTERGPVALAVIEKWEHKNTCKLATDLKNFYQTTDGLSIAWSVKFNGIISKLGHINICHISALKQLTIPTDVGLLYPGGEPVLHDQDGRLKPCWRDKIFEISSNPEYGKTCLVFITGGHDGGEIWFLDRSLQWHFLASTFTNFFRMLILHLGIPGWQYSFTDTGLSPETENWCNMFIPNIARGGTLSASSTRKSSLVSGQCNKLDSQKVFKQKWEKSKKESTSNKGGGGGGRSTPNYQKGASGSKSNQPKTPSLSTNKSTFRKI